MSKEVTTSSQRKAGAGQLESGEGVGPGVRDSAFNSDLLCRISTKYQAEHASPLARWHWERKFGTMAGLFRTHLHPHSKLIDIGCGDGDCMAVARAIEPSCELWGVDIDEPALALARRRLPGATVRRHDMGNLSALPQAYFDVVHEFGAAFLFRDWAFLAKAYLSLVRKGGFVIWELPEAMSMAHWGYLLSPAPRISEQDTLPKRLWRSFLPSKVTFQSWPSVQQYLEASGFNYRIVSRQPFLYFHVGRRSRHIVDFFSKRCSCAVFDSADCWAKSLFRRSSGYYLVLENLGKRMA
jgi:trans-aconitate methyltransferase